MRRPICSYIWLPAQALQQRPPDDCIDGFIRFHTQGIRCGEGTLQHDIREAEVKLASSLESTDPNESMHYILSDDDEYCDEEQPPKQKILPQYFG